MDRYVETESDRELLLTFIRQHKLPFTCSCIHGDRRSVEQNRLQRLWCNEISPQWGHSAEYVRGYCKLTIGVPILRHASEVFREKYDRILKAHSFEQKIELMMEPLDLPVTRMMTTKQKMQYLDEIYQHFTEKGLVLTQPER
jgi:hypothetical protein